MNLKMTLAEYPDAIADREKQLLRLQRKIRKLTNQLDSLNAEIEIEIATDPELKNEQQRKARRLEMLSQKNYLDIKEKLDTYLDRRTTIEINLHQVRNRFTVAKLEVRRQIALNSLDAA